MKLLLLSAAILAALTGCGLTSDSDSRNVQQHVHQVLPASGLRTLRVSNVSGAIDVTGAPGSIATIDYTKYAGHQSSIDNTQVGIDHTDTEIDAHVTYVKSGWFGSSGAGVDYKISVPPGTSVHLENVSGPVTVRNLAGNVEIKEVSGAVNAVLGRVAGDREVRIDTVSGGTTLAVSRNSDATIQMKNVSGSIRGFFTMSSDKGFVGQTARGRLGAGTATIDVSAVSGSITVNPE